MQTDNQILTEEQFLTIEATGGEPSPSKLRSGLRSGCVDSLSLFPSHCAAIGRYGVDCEQSAQEVIKSAQPRHQTPVIARAPGEDLTKVTTSGLDMED